MENALHYIVQLTPRDAFVVYRGEKGFIRMKRNVNKTGICGISQQASYPTVSKGSPVPSALPTPQNNIGVLLRFEAHDAIVDMGDELQFRQRQTHIRSQLSRATAPPPALKCVDNSG